MSEVIVAFWTGTGNTAEMAEYVAEGIREGGKEAKVVSVDDISAADLKDAAAFALGCPSMGVEQLEESTMEPFVEEVCGFASGKTIGLFGSYGWGDGEWMRNWVEQMEGAGAKVVGGEDTICQEAPDADAQDELKSMGKELAAIQFSVVKTKMNQPGIWENPMSGYIKQLIVKKGGNL